MLNSIKNINSIKNKIIILFKELSYLSNKYSNFNVKYLKNLSPIYSFSMNL